MQSELCEIIFFAIAIHGIEKGLIAMSDKLFSTRDEPLASEDLAVCRRVHEALCSGLNIDRSGEEADRLGALIIELYRQGVHDETQLRLLAGGKRG
ncbi:hypothetical protein AMC90_CH02613 [Rhizobium phaseoli]|uniref:Uncharacterized protein n=3 Tax=Rhizobium TaxID=379 RepID=A0ABN4QJ43_9HYPH|nr:hypothetical protein AMC90_CH02613 [Rhizobium phaseoli]MDH6650730.1 hypothetical protein [Rhizobium esperanzae]ANL41043.1 hypothetical protein AMC88_CH02666 [Rhizobium phaseoli]ANL53778.1 hypothetical protein AMC86_CH02651 [Rhizobium phaseoli]ANL60031.1 hypothetical protein AMC85_CH02665 [Rhizobium phaseoli]